ncbi:MAG: septum formation initiator family protein [Rikenellaceae bacterium]|nr:septum formation initiator family protein [Rikenellaceae bacterium]
MKKKKHSNILTNWQLILISTAVFLALILYLDGSNMRYKKSLDAKLEDLTGQRDSLREQIRRDSIMIKRLETDDKYLEKYAREHYYMKQEDEDLFVFE